MRTDDSAKLFPAPAEMRAQRWARLNQRYAELTRIHGGRSRLSSDQTDLLDAMTLLFVTRAQLTAVQARLAPADRDAVRQELDEWT